MDGEEKCYVNAIGIDERLLNNVCAPNALLLFVTFVKDDFEAVC